MQRLHALEARMLATPDQQISLTDPDARSMATSGRGSGVVGYNVQVAVDTEHHLIVTHEVTNVGTDRSQLAHVAKETKATLEAASLDVVADRGYFNGEEILACEEAGITVTLPKPMTSNSKAEGRFGKQDFRYLAQQDVYICPAGERLAYHYTNEENGLVLRRYWTNACAKRPASRSRCQNLRRRARSRKGASASRTFATWLRRTFTFVLPVRGSPTTIRTRKMDWSCAATGPTRAIPAR
jgi:hypothetical protein